MLDTVLNKARKTIRRHGMLNEGDHVLVAVSGGADSVALLSVLERLRPVFRMTLAAAHFNHRMRASESDRDELFVRALCRSLDIPLLKGSLKKGRSADGQSVEDFLRRERYAFLEQARKKAGATRVALGHNQDDQAETVLMNVIRGTGLAGLSGMPPVRDNGIYIRPLIDCPRLAIGNYLLVRGLSFVTDSSNTDVRFLRNRIRHTLMPELENRFNPSIRESLCRLAEVLREENDCLDGQAGEFLARSGLSTSAAGAFSLPLVALRKRHLAVQRRAVLGIARRLTAPGCTIGFEHVHAVLDLAYNGSQNGALDLPGGLRVAKSGGFMLFSQSKPTRHGTRGREEEEKKNVTFSMDVAIPGTAFVESVGMHLRFSEIRRRPPVLESKQKVCMDFDRISFPLVLRNARAGDRIQPLGMKGTRKLKSLFIDEKIPKTLRGGFPVLADRLSVLWVPGLRLSERARVGDGTKRILRAEII